MRPALSYYMQGDPASLWASAVHSRGGTVSDGRVALIRRLIVELKACGHWDATDDIAMLCGENPTQALTTLKQRRLMVVVNGPTFTVDRGYAFDGLSQYIDTGFVFVTHARAMAVGDLRLAVYERTNVASTGQGLGVGLSGGAEGQLSLLSRNGSNQLSPRLNTGVGTVASITDSRGLSAVSRAGAGSTIKAWKNGATLADITGLSTAGTGLYAIPLYIAARNTTGSGAAQFRGSTIGGAEWGAPLPGGTTAELAAYNAFQAHYTAIGANV